MCLCDLFFFYYIRGLPYWLREVPGIFFRTDNKQFKVLHVLMYTNVCLLLQVKRLTDITKQKLLQEHTERYVRMILDKMKEEKLFASQGGPIILGQVPNNNPNTFT